MQETSSESRFVERISVIFGAALLGIFVAAILTFLLPKKYAATLTMQVKSSPMTMVNGDSELKLSSADDKTVREILQPKILDAVVKTLHLTDKWGETDPEKARARLHQALSVRPIRNTELAAITALDTDPKFAATIANTVGEEYARLRNEKEAAQHEATFEQLGNDVAEKQKKVEAARAKQEAVRAELNITDPNMETPNIPDRQIPEEYLKVKSSYLEAKKALEASQIKLNTEKMETLMPRHSVMIWERAEAAKFPTWPRPGIIMILGCVLGLALGGFASLMIRR